MKHFILTIWLRKNFEIKVCVDAKSQVEVLEKIPEIISPIVKWETFTSLLDSFSIEEGF